jgi:hypothetical protein
MNNLPQIAMGFLFVAHLLAHWQQNGKPMSDRRYSLKWQTANVALWVAILYCGGFWR